MVLSLPDWFLIVLGLVHLSSTPGRLGSCFQRTWCNFLGQSSVLVARLFALFKASNSRLPYWGVRNSDGNVLVLLPGPAEGADG